VQILTEKQQTELGSIATEVTFRRRVNVYHADSPAHSVFIVKDGMVKAFQDLPSGRQRVLAFLFPGDVFGLAENGLYVNSTATVAPTTCFEIPIDALTGMFRRDDVANLARRYVAECLAVARAEGANLGDELVEQTVRLFTEVPEDLTTSILTDREHGRPLEWDVRNGVIARRAAAHGIPTPISDVLVPLLAAAGEGPG